MRLLHLSKLALMLAVWIRLNFPIFASQTAGKIPTDDASWALAFAAPSPPAPALSSDIGRGNQFIWDRRFLPLAKESFPQRQTFWYEHSRLVPVASLVLTFIGVTGDAILDQDRYVTVDGCVPHDCLANRGMLWIDTGSKPSTLLFAGIDLVHGGSGKDMSHLWIFSSEKLTINTLPKQFLFSVQRWLVRIGAKGYRGTSGYRYNFALVTLVQPNGVTVDIDPSDLHLNHLENGAGL